MHARCLNPKGSKGNELASSDRPTGVTGMLGLSGFTVTDCDWGRSTRDLQGTHPSVVCHPASLRRWQRVAPWGSRSGSSSGGGLDHPRHAWTAAGESQDIGSQRWGFRSGARRSHCAGRVRLRNLRTAGSVVRECLQICTDWTDFGHFRLGPLPGLSTLPMTRCLLPTLLSSNKTAARSSTA